jgi:hypothetical protein
LGNNGKENVWRNVRITNERKHKHRVKKKVFLLSSAFPLVVNIPASSPPTPPPPFSKLAARP